MFFSIIGREQFIYTGTCYEQIPVHEPYKYILFHTNQLSGVEMNANART